MHVREAGTSGRATALHDSEWLQSHDWWPENFCSVSGRGQRYLPLAHTFLHSGCTLPSPVQRASFSLHPLQHSTLCKAPSLLLCPYPLPVAYTVWSSPFLLKRTLILFMYLPLWVLREEVQGWACLFYSLLHFPCQWLMEEWACEPTLENSFFTQQVLYAHCPRSWGYSNEQNK